MRTGALDVTVMKRKNFAQRLLDAFIVTGLFGQFEFTSGIGFSKRDFLFNS